LEGVELIKEFDKSEENLRLLYTGKVGLDDLPLVKSLLDSGALKEAKYFPETL